MDKSKPFGLVLPKKAKAFSTKVNAIFGSDSDDEPVKKKSTPIPQTKPLSKKQEQKELCEDPSIYEYDNIYDDMKAKEVAKIAGPKDNKPSRYINTLLKAADKRKKEYERRVERKVQVEREKEGDKFKDKEAFVTSAYKKKMQEMEEEEERERRENMLNEMMDVTKQKDLSGFYRHFLKQSVGEEKVPEFGDKFNIKQEPMSDDDAERIIKVNDQKKGKDHGESKAKRVDHHSSEKKKKHNESDEDDSYHHSSETKKKKKHNESDDDSYHHSSEIKKKKRYNESDEDDSYHHSYKYQKKNTEKVSDAKTSKDSKNFPLSKHKTKIYRKNEHSSDDEKKYTPSTSKSEIDKLPASNLDQDSDIVDSEEEANSDIKTSKEKRSSKTTSDSDNSCSDNKNDNMQKKKTSKLEKNIRKRTNNDSDVSDSSKENEDNSSSPPSEHSMNRSNKKTDNTGEDEQPKIKRNIFEKRTVGEVFAAAQVRYFQRMAARNA